jgi:transcriptional regulator with XRE-family HTH domain
VLALLYNSPKVGKNLKLQRLKRELSKEQLCEILQIKIGHLDLIEHGQRGISHEVLSRLDTVFGITESILLKDNIDIVLDVNFFEKLEEIEKLEEVKRIETTFLLRFIDENFSDKQKYIIFHLLYTFIEIENNADIPESDILEHIKKF